MERSQTFESITLVSSDNFLAPWLRDLGVRIPPLQASPSLQGGCAASTPRSGCIRTCSFPFLFVTVETLLFLQKLVCLAVCQLDVHELTFWVHKCCGNLA